MITEEKTGILYFNVGDSHLRRLHVAIASTRKHEPTIPICVCHIGDLGQVGNKLKSLGVATKQIPDVDGSALVKKVWSIANSPFENTLFLDSDTLMVNPIGNAFAEFSKADVDFSFVNFASWSASDWRIKKRVDNWVNKGAPLPDFVDIEDSKSHKAINVGSFFYRSSTSAREFIDLWLRYTKLANEKRVFIPDEIFAQICLPYISHTIIGPEWGASPKYGPHTDQVIVHYHGDKHQASYPSCSKWEEMEAELYPEVVDNTVVVVFDADYKKKLGRSAKTWRECRLLRPNKHKLLVLTDDSVSAEDVSEILHFDGIETKHVVCEVDKSLGKRERMIKLFVSEAPYLVDTRFWTKLDADCSAQKDTKLFHSSTWRKRDIVSHKWWYTKPGSWIQELENWRSGIDLGERPYDQKPCGRIFKHQRFQSFVCFHNTAASRTMSDLISAHGLYDMVPSHDTLYSFLAKTLGLSVHTENLKEWGFKHG